MRTLFTLVFLLLTTLAYCQKTTLLQNTNPRAKELKHKLNKTGDSLILEGERTIYRVEIFNQEYGKAISVKNSKIIVALDDIPKGRFVVEATLIDKLILITLLRNESYNEEELIVPIIPKEEVAVVNKVDKSPLSRVFSKKKESKPSTKKIAINKKATITPKKEVLVVNNVDRTPLSRAFSKKKEQPNTKKIEINKKAVIAHNKAVTTKIKIEDDTKKIKRSYWLVYETRNRHSSQRIMRMADKALVNKMIAKNNLDLRTVAGKSNILTVWEVYDVTKFMRYKRINRNKLTKESDCFNIVPFFKTKESKLASR